MKWFCLSVLIICLVLCLISCASIPKKAQEEYRNEPDGFRGIKWGTEINSLSDFVYIDLPGTDDPTSFLGGLEVFTRNNDDLHFGKVDLSDITYSFWKNKFFMVSLFIKGKKNWQRLKEVAFEKFGKSTRGHDSGPGERYEWHGAIAHIGMEFWKSSSQGYLMIYSDEIMRKRFEKFEETKADREDEEVIDGEENK